MPLGVSEGLLKEAYGPINFDGFYKQLDSASKRMQSAEATQRQNDLKDYALTKAALNKGKVGVRADDVPLATKAFNEWAAVAKKQMNVSLRRNPDLWGELEKKKTDLETQYNTITQGSKELSKQLIETRAKLSDPEKRHLYGDNALEEFNKNTSGKSYFDIIKDGSHFLDKYGRKDIDPTKFETSLSKNLSAKNISSDYKIAEEYNVNGQKQVRYNKYNNVPDISKLHSAVESSLGESFHSQREKTAFVQQEIKRIQDNGDFNKVSDAWNALSDTQLRKMGIGKPDKFDPTKGASNEEIYTNYLTAKHFIDNLPKSPSETTTGEFMSDAEKMSAQEMMNKRRDERRRAEGLSDWYKKFDYTKSHSGDTSDAQSIIPLFDTALSGGEAHLQVAKAVPDILGPNFYPAAVKPSTTKIPEFQAGSEALSLFLKGKDKKDFIKDNTSYKEVADRINEINNENGVITKVSPTEVREGQLVLHDLGIDSKGSRKMIVYGMKDKLSRNQLDFGVKQLQMSSKQKRADLSSKIGSSSLIEDPLGLND